MLTVEDIRNPKRKSGFANVIDTNTPNHPRPDAPFQAHAGSNPRHAGEKTNRWRGPVRRTAEEAAQDHCDYINSGQAPAPTPRVARARKPILNLRRTNHPARPRNQGVRSPKQPSKRVLREASRDGYVYLVGITHNDRAAKIGWSKDAGFARLRELQTGNYEVLVGLAEIPGTTADEYALHLRYEADNILNEWFEVSDELLAEFDVPRQEFEILTGTLALVAA